MHPIRTTAALLLAATSLGCLPSGAQPSTYKTQPAEIFAIEAPDTAAVRTAVTLKAWVQTYQNGGYDDAILWPSTFTATVDEAAKTVRVSGKVLVTSVSGPVPASPRNFFAVTQEVTFAAQTAGTYTIEIAPENVLATFTPGFNHRGPSGVTVPAPAAKRTITIQ